MRDPGTIAAERGLLGGLDEQTRAAVRVAWQAFWTSRLLVWVTGVLAFGVLGRASGTEQFDPLNRLGGLGAVSELLIAPAARYDSVWYLAVADLGYEQSTRTVFFPVYPILLRLGDELLGSALAVGILVSAAAFFVSLVLLYRLALLDLTAEQSRLAVLLVAFFPAAFVLSALYTEALYLMLSVGAVYAARTGRWGAAGALGACAAATRSAGILLVIPLVVLFVWGPHAVRPRRSDILWIGLVPLGLVAYLGFLALSTGEPLTPFTAQQEWHRTLTGPLGGIWLGAVSAVEGAGHVLSVPWGPLQVTRPGGDPVIVGLRHLAEFAFLVLSLWGLALAVRRLPRAYTAYLAASLALPLSVPASTHPLMSLPRFMAVVFPLHLALAVWATERSRERLVLGAGGLLLTVFTALFATWTWAG